MSGASKDEVKDTIDDMIVKLIASNKTTNPSFPHLLKRTLDDDGTALKPLWAHSALVVRAVAMDIDD